eukprot:COSAG01_NODE_17_length_39991_cov_30.596160_11_plen_152_part_00
MIFDSAFCHKAQTEHISTSAHSIAIHPIWRRILQLSLMLVLDLHRRFWLETRLLTLVIVCERGRCSLEQVYNRQPPSCWRPSHLAGTHAATAAWGRFGAGMRRDQPRRRVRRERDVLAVFGVREDVVGETAVAGASDTRCQLVPPSSGSGS